MEFVNFFKDFLIFRKELYNFIFTTYKFTAKSSVIKALLVLFVLKSFIFIISCYKSMSFFCMAKMPCNLVPVVSASFMKSVIVSLLLKCSKSFTISFLFKNLSLALSNSNLCMLIAGFARL